MDDLQGLLAQFQPTEEDRRRARQQALMAAGLGLLGARRGQEWQQAGQAGLLGMGAYNQQLQDATRQRALGVETASRAAQLQQMMQQQEQQKRMQALIPQYMGAPPGTQGPMPNGGAVPTGFDYQGYAGALAGVDPMKALQLQQALQKEQPKVKEIRTQTDPSSGKPVDVIYFENGDTKVVPFGTARKMVQVPLGGSVGFVDENTVQPGTQLPKTISPDTAADLPFKQDARKLAWANYGLQRQKFAYDQEQGGKPQIITGPNGEVYSVNPTKGTGSPVIGPDGQPLNKGEKPLTSDQGMASVYLGMMKSASKDITDLSSTPNLGGVAAARGDVPFISRPIQNYFAPKNAQKYAQSSRQWTEAALRITTGATAPPEEVTRMTEIFWPQINDDAEVIAQKAARRADMEQLVAIKAGKGAQQAEAVVGGTKKTVVRRGTEKETGRRVVQYDDGSTGYE